MKLSVCITHFNRPDKLGATLESLARQTRTPDEVFLWDDCSPNDPTKVALAYRDRFPHFVYHRNDRNLNMPGNLNAVLAQATGDYIANLHDADQFDPTLLKKWESALLGHPRAGLVFCGLAAPGRVFLEDLPAFCEGGDFFRRVFVGSSGSPIWGTVMVRRAVYERHLPFDPQFRNWADVDMWMRICSTDGIAYVREPLISLDNSPRSFAWAQFLICHHIIFANLYRMAANREELLRFLDAQRLCTNRCYVRHLAGRLLRGEARLFLEGFRHARDVFVRLPALAYQLDAGKTLRLVPAPGA